MELRVRLLGIPAIASSQHEAAVSLRPQAWSLLAYLLLAGDCAIPRSRVAFTLWPDVTEAAALANLRRHAFLLARALPSTPGGWLDASRTTIGIRKSADVSTDIDTFERCSRDPNDVDRAVSLYRGDFLEGLDEDWVVAERDRLRELHIDNLGRHVFRLRECGRYRAAITAGRRLLLLDPFREDTVRQMLALHAAVGDRAGALAEYERFARRLREAIGVEPMAQTVACAEAIRSWEPAYTAAVAS